MFLSAAVGRSVHMPAEADRWDLLAGIGLDGSCRRSRGRRDGRYPESIASSWVSAAGRDPRFSVEGQVGEAGSDRASIDDTQRNKRSVTRVRELKDEPTYRNPHRQHEKTLPDGKQCVIPWAVYAEPESRRREKRLCQRLASCESLGGMEALPSCWPRRGSFRRGRRSRSIGAAALRTWRMPRPTMRHVLVLLQALGGYGRRGRSAKVWPSSSTIPVRPGVAAARR